MPVKYRREVPSISTMASSPFSTISFRACSWRSWRSSRVIGCASAFRDFNRAIEGGREVSSADAASAKEGVTRAPAKTPPAERNRRRESMKSSKNLESSRAIIKRVLDFVFRWQISDLRTKLPSFRKVYNLLADENACKCNSSLCLSLIRIYKYVQIGTIPINQPNPYPEVVVARRVECPFRRRKRSFFRRSPSWAGIRSSATELRVLEAAKGLQRLFNHLHEGSTSYISARRLQLRLRLTATSVREGFQTKVSGVADGPDQIFAETERRRHTC